jgi:hypothetical protein
MTGSLLFTAVANNVRLEKSGSFLNLLDTYSNIHLYNGGDGIYIDSNVHYWRSQGATHWMALNSTGLGIGTQSPETKFHVAGGKITLKGGSSTDQQIVFNYAREYVNGIYNSSGHFRLQDNSLAGTVYQWDGSTFAFPNGNIGIGTTSPGTKLEVNGGATGNNIARFTTGGTGGGTRGLTMYSDSSQVKLQVSDNAGGIGTWAFLNLNPDGGNVGIGTTNPIYKLQIAGSTYVNGGTLFLDSDQYLRWGNSNQGIVGSNDNHVSIVSGGATRQSIYADGRTYFPGLDLSISNVNSTHGTANYFRGDTSHLVIGTGGTLYLNYGGSTTNITGTTYINGNLVWHAGNDGSGSGLDADLLDGNHASYFINTSNIGSQSVASATTSTSTYRGIIEDTRAAERTPNDYDDYRVSWEFTNQIPGLNYSGASWWSAMTMQGWHNGYSAWQIIGSASSAIDDFYLRAGNNTTWNTARRIWHSGDFTSTNVSSWNTAYSWGNHANAGYLTSVSDVWVNTTGDTMTGNLNFGATSNLGLTWGLNTDAAFIRFTSTGNGAGQSYLEIGTQDDSDEEIKFTQSGNVRFYLATDGFLKNGSGYKYVFENGTWGINITGNANYATTASALTSMNISQFTNNSGYVAYGNYSWTSPVFGQYGIKSNLIDNVLYSAADRFEVFRDGVAWNTNCLFALNYDNNCDVIPTSTSRTYSIVLNTKGNGSSGITYTEGNVYLSFYYVQIPASVSGRVRFQNGTWVNMSGWTNVANNVSYAVWRGNVPGGNYMVEIEITINSGSSVDTWFAQWEYVMGRPGQYELGIINKAQDNSLWRNMYFRDSSNNVQVSIGASGLSTSQNLNISGTSALTFGSYGGGFYMQDSSWIRTVNYKSIWTQTGLLGTDGGLTVGYGGTTPPSGGAIIAGNVGIGTSSPSALLDVNGRVIVGGGLNGNAFSISTSIGTYTFNNYDLNTPSSFLITAGSSGYLSLDGYPVIFKVLGSEKMRVHTSGNIGIGTTTPQKKLDVFGSAGIVASIGSNIGPGQFAGLHFGYSESYVNNDSYKKSALVFERTDNHGQGGNASGKIHFLLNNIASNSANSLNDSVVTIDSDASATVGSVRMGIGTRNPTTPLHVIGIIQVEGGGSTTFYGTDGSGSYARNFGTQLYTFRDAGGSIITTINTTSGVITTTGGNSTQWNTAYSWGNHASAGYLTSVSDIWVNTAGDTMTGSLLFTAVANNVRLEKSGSFLNLLDTYSNIHLYNSGNGIYIDSNVHYWRSQGATHWMALNSTGLGIGTQSPETKLHVSGGPITLKGGSSTDQQIVYNYAREYVNGIYNSSGHFRLQDNSLGGTVYQWDGSTFAFPNGNVGIGTTSPANKLTIQSNSTQLRLETASDPSAYHTLIESNYNSSNPLNIYSSAAASNAMGTIVLSGITGVNTYLNSYYGIVFGTSTSSITTGTVRMMITNGGNVGIGTTFPGSKLSILGNNDVLNVTSQTGDTSLPTKMLAQYVGLFNNGVNGHHLYINSSQELGSAEFNITKTWGGYLTFGVSGDGTARTRALYVNANGYVGVNVNPISGDRFEVAGSVRIHTGNNWDAIQIYSDGANGYIQGLGDETGLRIRSEYGNILLADNRGKVGIGTSSPSENLHVIGRGIFDGGSGNSSTDAVLYVTKSNNNDWGLYVNAAALDYGMYARVSPSANYAIAVNNGTSWTTRITGDGRIYLNEKDTIASYDTWLRLNESSHYGSGVYTPGVMRADGGFYIGGNAVWYPGNDGSGSGLDADLLDGQHGSYFINTSNIGSQSVSYASSAGSATTSTSTYRGIIEDTRAAERTPNDYDDYRVSWEFTNQIPGLNYSGASWWSAMTMQGWHNGYSAWQIIGSASSAIDDFYLRAGNNTTWNTARRIWHSGDFTSTNVSNWNTAFGWGNHASAGYLTSVTAHTQAWSTITSTPTTISGYGITNAYTDTQIQNFFSGANAISGYNKSNWDTAYGWGNHASSGYIVAGSTISDTGSWTNATKFKSSGDISYGGAGNHSLQIFSDTNNDAFIAFHISGDHAVYFGLDDASNRLHTGGWSDGANKYQLWDTRDFTSSNVSNWNTTYSWGNHASYSYATTSYVTTQINNLVNGAPGVLDTLNELATALGNDASFSTTITNSIATKLPLAGGTMSGTISFINNIGTALQGTVGDNDFWRIYANSTSSNAGYLEIATSDDGTEPIYVRQYTGVFSSLTRTATLLDGAGNTSFPGNLNIGGFLTESSSLKLKENVKTSEGNLEKVVNLRPVTYNKIGSETIELGLIAEEVAEVYPEFVQYDENGDPIGVNYSRLTAALIGAVKELTNQVQELNKKING